MLVIVCKLRAKKIGSDGKNRTISYLFQCVNKPNSYLKSMCVGISLLLKYVYIGHPRL
jgi:hypothetical protein